MNHFLLTLDFQRNSKFKVSTEFIALSDKVHFTKKNLLNTNSHKIRFKVFTIGQSTVCKLQNFYVTQILREIKVDKSGVLKSAILTNWEALKSDFHFLHFLEADSYQITTDLFRLK